MNWPLEGSRDVHDGIIVSMVPDVCLTPQGDLMMPVPYTIWCRQADAANLANSVRQTDDRSHAVASLVLHCHGDEPGTGGGVFSGTTGAECTPKTWSHSVRAEGRNMVRHTDEWWMNHRNTYGQLIYTKDMNIYENPPTQQITPQMPAASPDNTASPASRSQTSQLAQAYAVPPTSQGMKPPRGRPQMGPTGMEAPDGSLVPMPGLLGKFDKGARVAQKFMENCCIASYYENAAVFYLPEKGENGKWKTDENGKIVKFPKGGLGGCQQCGIAKEGSVAHHGIVDFTIRSGGKDNSSMRPNSAPSYWEALTICIPAGDEHEGLHREFAANMKASANEKTGLSTWANAKKYSFQEIDSIPDASLSKRCKEIYKKKLESSYRFSGDMLTRADPNNPPDANPKGEQYQLLHQDWQRR